MEFTVTDIVWQPLNLCTLLTAGWCWKWIDFSWIIVNENIAVQCYFISEVVDLATYVSFELVRNDEKFFKENKNGISLRFSGTHHSWIVIYFVHLFLLRYVKDLAGKIPWVCNLTVWSLSFSGVKTHPSSFLCSMRDTYFTVNDTV